jgi:hypothetical protein
MSRALDEVSRETVPPEAILAMEKVEGELAEAIASEMDWRARSGLPVPSADRAAMERYLARASELKKHFETALYLTRESRAIEKRTEPWIAAIATVMAGGVAFLIQPSCSGCPWRQRRPPSARGSCSSRWRAVPSTRSATGSRRCRVPG